MSYNNRRPNYNNNYNKQQQFEYVVKGQEDTQQQKNQDCNQQDKDNQFVDSQQQQQRGYTNNQFKKKPQGEKPTYYNKNKEFQQQDELIDNDAQFQQQNSKNKMNQSEEHGQWGNSGRSQGRSNQGRGGQRRPQNNYYNQKGQKGTSQGNYKEDLEETKEKASGRNRDHRTKGVDDDQNQDNNQKDQQIEESNDEIEAEKQSEDTSQDPEDNIKPIQQAPIKERTEILIKLFKRDRAQCQICCNKMNKQSKIWNCQQCYQPFHLSCIQKWIKNIKQATNHKSTGKDDPASKQQQQQQHQQQIYNWTCPSCLYQYTEQMPQYYCFCNKQLEPEFDPYGLPHSCGQQCEKKRGINCPHLCPMDCHPGPCEPCMQKGQDITCYCGKNKRETLCHSDIKSFQCNELCLTKLNCGKHFCQRQCHPGQCDPCQIKVKATCYCGKTQADKNCGQEQFECKKLCNKTLDCGQHFCQFPCHKGECKPCQLKPSIVNKCPCGQFALTTLAGGNFRKACTDLIPVCGLPCKKLLPCGKHQCKKSCHNGPCPPCTILVEENCRCGYSQQNVECGTLYLPGREQFVCDHRCKKKLSCKLHKCEIICCSARQGGPDVEGVHLCVKVCGKMLSCGTHSCENFCHIGICNKCPVFINQPLFCTCGKTKLQPPLPCGTKRPECTFPCIRKRPGCDHPCHLNCHEDPCPPCEEKVSKYCRCGQSIVDNVSCSKEALCLKQCSKILACGHKCGETCHIGECPKALDAASPQGCGKKCGKLRPQCQHICLAQCHPGQECPKKDPCKAEICVVCPCGNRETYIECGSTDCPIEHTLNCNIYCGNKKRFGLFYELNKNQVYYPALLIRFAKQYLPYLLKLEQKIDQMIKNCEESIDMSFIYDQKKRLAVQILLNRHYKLDTLYYSNCKNPFFVIRTTPNMIIPKPLLSEYLKKIEQGLVKPDIMPFEVTIRINTQASYTAFQEIDFLLKEFEGDYYIEKDEHANQSISVYFWDKDKADQGQKKLKKSQSIYSNFIFELNQKLKFEESKDEHAAEEVVHKKLSAQLGIQKVSSNSKSSSLIQEMSKHIDEIENYMLSMMIGQKNYASVIKQEKDLYQERACCEQMCPKKEQQEREDRMDISLFEQDPSTSQMKILDKWAVKKFLRLETESNPEKVRLPIVLAKSVNYLFVQVLDADAQVNVCFKMPKNQKGQKRLINFIDIYGFINDRLLAIRQDLTLVKGSDEYPELSIPILEQIIRFAVLCLGESQLMLEEDEEEKEQNKNSSTFDMYLHLNELSTVLKMLHEAYKEQQKKQENQQQSSKHNLDCIAEFSAYLLLMVAQKNLHLEQYVEEMSQELLEHADVKTALEIICAIKINDYTKFFKILKKSSFFVACIMSLFVNNMRINSLKIMQKLKISLTLKQFSEQLCFDSESDAVAFLQINGINTVNLEAPDEYETDNEGEEQKQVIAESSKNAENKDVDQSVQLISDNQNQNCGNDKEIQAKQLQNTTDIEGQQEIQPLKEKKMKLKIQYINWKPIKDAQDEESQPQFGINLLLLEKRNVQLFTNYQEQREFNNNNIVSRLYLVKGLWKLGDINNPKNQGNQQ